MSLNEQQPVDGMTWRRYISPKRPPSGAGLPGLGGGAYFEEETVARTEATLKRMLTTPKERAK